MANEILKVQKLANSSAKAIQKLVNKANEKALKFNAQEAKKAREFNAKEASTARTFNANESAIARAFNASEAQKARDWQTEMSNTAHQREVEDLKKAGLNPVLSAGAGATSYTTSSASASPASAVGASANNASGNVESGAGAIGNLFAGMMSAMTGLEQTRLQTQATIRASEIAASASRYVADRNYDTHMDQPQNSVVGVVDKYFGKVINTSEAKTLSKYVKQLDAGNNVDIKNGQVYLHNSTSKNAVKNGLKSLGLDFTGDNAYLFVKAFAYNDTSALKKLEKLARNTKSAAKSISSNSPFKGNNWNPYNP